MKSFIPGHVSKRDMAVLKETQSEFLDEITENPIETAYRAKCHADWLASTFKKPNKGNDLVDPTNGRADYESSGGAK
jgi:hypothetical protein